MPLYNFKARFAEAVATGQKCQTIRALRRDNRNPEVGEPLYLYTGIRTKKVRKLRVAKTTNVRPIQIDEQPYEGQLLPLVFLDGHLLAPEELEQMARRDGFGDTADFMAWFRQLHGYPFSGILIEWE
jgi:hypothetical protein